MGVIQNPSSTAGSASLGRDRLQTGPVPGWASPTAVDRNFKGNAAAPLTYLILEQQINAETRQSFHHIALRLETMQAVQHNSQWRLEFEPHTQSVTLHSIKILRAGAEIDHLNLDKIHMLQRESGLERFTIDGWSTLLLLLDDVRPGDVLEWSCTIETHHRWLPEYCCHLFTLPPHVPIGKFFFSVHFNERRALKWKSSAAHFQPAERKTEADTLWAWSGQIIPDEEIEPNIVEWYLNGPWVQVSDCTSWETVAHAISKVWHETPPDETVAALAKEISEQEPDDSARVEKALRLVQDEYRYLSVNLELGGQIPTAPGTVARRRYGDCKDLSFLLAHLLRALGIKSRPVLVHTKLRKSVAEMLPMAGLFNHAVVEFQIQDQTRWVDATMRRQGGGALNRFIPDYGVGLAVDDGPNPLIEAPRIASAQNSYDLKESILLDTTGAASYLAVTVHAKGSHAEALRSQLEVQGEKALSDERLRLYVQTFSNVKRSSPMQFRDDRAANEFVLAEVYEINGFLQRHPNPRLCSVPLSNNLVTGILKLPEDKPRKTPFALPYPCNATHIIEVLSPAIAPFSTPRSLIESPLVRFSRVQKSLHGSFSVTFSLSTLSNAVSPEMISEHRKTVEEVWKQAFLSLNVQVGQPHQRKRSDFGALPLPSRRSAPVSPPKKVEPPSATTAVAPAAPLESIETNIPQAATASTEGHKPPAAIKPRKASEQRVLAPQSYTGPRRDRSKPQRFNADVSFAEKRFVRNLVIRIIIVIILGTAALIWRFSSR